MNLAPLMHLLFLLLLLLLLLLLQLFLFLLLLLLLSHQPPPPVQSHLPATGLPVVSAAHDGGGDQRPQKGWGQMEPRMLPPPPLFPVTPSPLPLTRTTSPWEEEAGFS